ncbi:MAG: hypothetical protein EPN22_11565 [Nitrospirae bacterium]|nr:MAG: hypothetical protein EPN22_11565 [Nitrospirota bacterium]
MPIELIKKILNRNKKRSESVASVLGALTEDYKVFKDMLYNQSSIDYVIFNRERGFFMVNLLHGKGDVSCDGKNLLMKKKVCSDIIRKTLQDVFWLKSTIRERIGIDAAITPFVVCENARVKLDTPFAGINVIESGALRGAMLTPLKEELPQGMLVLLRELYVGQNLSSPTI